jgi:hypothetical protein
MSRIVLSASSTDLNKAIGRNPSKPTVMVLDCSVIARIRGKRYLSHVISFLAHTLLADNMTSRRYVLVRHSLIPSAERAVRCILPTLTTLFSTAHARYER